MPFSDIEAKLNAAYQQKLQDWQQQYNAYQNYKPSVAGVYSGAVEGAKGRYDEVMNLAKRADLGEEQYNTIWQALTNEDQNANLHLQGLREYAVAGDQRKQAQTDLQDFRNRAETRMFGGTGQDIASALSNPQGDLGALGQFLAGQQSDVFKQNLAPLIQQKLGGQGLIDSGANVELQSKALGDLERSRQSQLMNAALGYRDQISGLERSDILGNIGSQQQALSNLSDLQRQGITMSFQRELENKRENLARELSSISNSGPGLMNQILGYGGAAASIGFAPMTGGTSLLGLPGFLAMSQMPEGQGGAQGGMGAAQLGSSFFAGQPKYGINQGQNGYYAPGYPTRASMGPSWNG